MAGVAIVRPASLFIQDRHPRSVASNHTSLLWAKSRLELVAWQEVFHQHSVTKIDRGKLYLTFAILVPVGVVESNSGVHAILLKL